MKYKINTTGLQNKNINATSKQAELEPIKPKRTNLLERYLPNEFIPYTVKKQKLNISKKQILDLQKKGFSYSQIAKKLNCSKTTVFNRLHEK